MNHLTLAVLADPKNAAARGLMGLVLRDGRWSRPEVIAEKAKADALGAATLAEYESRRLKAPYTADGQWSLGLWADEHGLKDQAKAHLTAVTRLAPSRDEAWKRLGYKKQEGRWVTEAQLVAEKVEREAQKLADRKWKTLLERYKAMLVQPSRREEAEESLAGVTDPRAVPSIAQAFVTGRAADQLRAVQLLGQVEAPSASRVLAGLAVLSDSAEVRRKATETLKLRDPRDFVRLWIALIRKPIHYVVKPVGGPGSPGTLFVEGQRVNLQRIYSPPPLPTVPYLPGATLDYDQNGLPVLHQSLGRFTDPQHISPSEVLKNQAAELADKSRMIAGFSQQLARSSNVGTAHLFADVAGRLSGPYNNIIHRYSPNADPRSGFYLAVYARELTVPIGEMIRETQVSAEVAKQQLASDVATLDGTNAAIRRANEPVLQALKDITGGDLGEDGTSWNRWWADREGFVAITAQDTPRPTLYEQVAPSYTPQAAPAILPTQVVGFIQGHSCFAAGTTVRTIDGDRAIESIRPGDLVLVQDTKSGGLGYQSVITAYHNPPNATLRVKLGDDAVVATGIHRFWKAGQGWTMARDLKAGDLVRTLGGVASVSSIEDDKVQPVFNLELGEGHSFLVGKLGALVHDNSPVEAIPAPFDAGSVALAVAKGK